MAFQLLHNAQIYTMDNVLGKANAMVINEAGCIEAIGDLRDINRQFSSFDQIWDCENRTILPGFNDAHIHVWKVGQLRTFMLDVRGVQSIAEFQQRLKDFALKNPNLPWITARGINEMQLKEKRLPTKEDLDCVVPDRPVYVIRTCAHMAIVNTNALEVAKVDINTEVPYGGEILKNADGSLQGIFTERAMGLIQKVMPEYSITDYKKMILEAQEYLLSLGITSATDPAADPNLLAAYLHLEKEGALKIRMNVFPLRIPDGSDSVQELPSLFHSDFLQIQTVKFFSDGGLSTATAALNVPYKNTNDYKGVLRLDYDKFLESALEAVKGGFSVATHAIGHQAVDLTLKVYSALHEQNPNLKHRMEHVGFLSAKNLADFQRMNMSAAMQPIFIYELAKNFEATLPEELFPEVYPCKLVLDHQINLALSTDGPVVNEVNPWVNMQTALTRQSKEGLIIGENQAITMPQALYAYTMGSAIAENREQSKGSLTVGKKADFILVDQDPFLANDLSSITTLQTWVGGQLYFTKH